MDQDINLPFHRLHLQPYVQFYIPIPIYVSITPYDTFNCLKINDIVSSVKIVDGVQIKLLKHLSFKANIIKRSYMKWNYLTFKVRIVWYKIKYII